jgi:acylphosphatase
VKTAAYIRVLGLVQGVSYRYFAQKVARGLKLQGTVRNRHDGSVELEVEGERGLIEELITSLKIGPPSAHVTDVRVEWRGATDRYEDFRIAF